MISSWDMKAHFNKVPGLITSLSPSFLPSSALLVTLSIYFLFLEHLIQSIHRFSDLILSSETPLLALLAASFLLHFSFFCVTTNLLNNPCKDTHS